MVTVWRLQDQSGKPASCTVSERDGRWQLIVHRGREMMLAEQCQTDEAALSRANEVWQALLEAGWTEKVH